MVIVNGGMELESLQCVCDRVERRDLCFYFCFEDMKGYTDGPDLLFHHGMELATMQHPHTDMPCLRNIVLELPCWALWNLFVFDLDYDPTRYKSAIVFNGIFF